MFHTKPVYPCDRISRRHLVNDVKTLPNRISSGSIRRGTFLRNTIHCVMVPYLKGPQSFKESQFTVNNDIFPSDVNNVRGFVALWGEREGGDT